VVSVADPKFYEREDCKCANVLLGLRASNKGVPEMCDFSLYSLRSRPAQVGDSSSRTISAPEPAASPPSTISMWRCV
jgi:hypothetical protein